MNAALLYEHSDGRRRVALSAESATFTVDDPSWWRAGPVELPAACTAATELLAELQLAHAIITTLQNMIPADRKWDMVKALSKVHDGEGAVRYHERAAAIARAAGRAT